MQARFYRMGHQYEVPSLLGVVRVAFRVVELPCAHAPREVCVLLRPTFWPETGGEGTTYVAGAGEVEVHAHVLKERLDVLVHEWHPGVQ